MIAPDEDEDPANRYTAMPASEHDGSYDAGSIALAASGQAAAEDVELVRKLVLLSSAND